MNFIDHTGHLFQLKSYRVNPIGYEYEETKYVFWFENEQGYKFSVDTYAIKPIRVVLDDEIDKIAITIDSQKFSLISSSVIQDKIQDGSYNIELREREGKFEDGVFVNDLSYDSESQDNKLIVLNGLKDFETNIEYSLVPFYVAMKSDEAGTWQSNVLVYVKYKGGHEEWCPFTIAVEVVDECEELIINGQNMGVKLPKEIMKAVYQSSYSNGTPDERMYAQKLKEYLMNFMDIKGQTGNYKSALNALKWFGWGDKLDIYKLFRTDNEFQVQYIRDNFDIVNDMLYSYRKFRNESLLALSLDLEKVSETNTEYDFNTENGFWGEGKPELENLLESSTIVHYDEGDLDFYKPYFDFEFNELGLKLCMLKYYYEKYFLPLHMSINSVSMKHRVFANDIKYLSNCAPKITADPIFMEDTSINVMFPHAKELFLTAQTHEVDDNFCEFDFNKSQVLDAKWQMYETCVCIPIFFESENEEQYYDTILTLTKDGKKIFSRNFQFNTSDLLTKTKYDEDAEEDVVYAHYLNFIVHPKTFNRYIGYNENGVYDDSTYETNKKFSINLWLDSTYTINIWCNGNNYSYTFTLRLPDFGLKMGKLKYEYSRNFRQLYWEDGKANFLSFMWMPGLVTVDNIDFVDDLYFFQDNLNDYVAKYYSAKTNIISDKQYFNRCHLYKLKKDGEEIAYEGNVFDDVFKLEFKNVEIDGKQYNELQLASSLSTDLETNVDLYKQFFNFDAAIEDSPIEYKGNIFDATESNSLKVKYDFYLMHEKTGCWYVVLISQNTIGKYTEEELKAPVIETFTGYSFEYEMSDDKFLVNRYTLEETGGDNKFNQSDIIAFYLESNYKLPYKVGLSTKWLIKPMSIGMNNSCTVDSPNEIAIVSVGDINFKYEKGYYTVVCRYSLDDFYQESVEKKGIFMIK